MSEKRRDISWWVSLIGGLIGILAAIAGPFIYFEGRLDQIESMVIQRDKEHASVEDLDELEDQVDELVLDTQVNKLKIQVFENLSDSISFLE